jgi:CcmD family protein
LRGYRFLFWAYNAIWAGLAVYLVYLAVRLNRVRAKIDKAERALREESRRS